MNRLKFFSLGVLFVSLILMLVGFTGTGRALADQMKPLLVQIVNLPDQPVPVEQQIATQSRLIQETIPSGQNKIIDFESIDASTIIISSDPNDNLLFDFKGEPVTILFSLYDPHESAKVIALTQKVRLNTVNIVCISKDFTSCSLRISIIGN